MDSVLTKLSMLLASLQDWFASIISYLKAVIEGMGS